MDNKSLGFMLQSKIDRNSHDLNLKRAIVEQNIQEAEQEIEESFDMKPQEILTQDKLVEEAPEMIEETPEVIESPQIEEPRIEPFNDQEVKALTESFKKAEYEQEESFDQAPALQNKIHQQLLNYNVGAQKSLQALQKSNNLLNNQQKQPMRQGFRNNRLPVNDVPEPVQFGSFELPASDSIDNDMMFKQFIGQQPEEASTLRTLMQDNLSEVPRNQASTMQQNRRQNHWSHSETSALDRIGNSLQRDFIDPRSMMTRRQPIQRNNGSLSQMSAEPMIEGLEEIEEIDHDEIMDSLDEDDHKIIRRALNECSEDETCDLSKIQAHMADRGFDSGFFSPFLDPRPF